MSDTLQSSTAIISDVHGNCIALDAVLADIAQRGIRTIINIGDTVGYGPDPEVCIDRVMACCTFNLCGNHEYAILNTADGFNPVASGAIHFARQRLKPTEDCRDSDQLRRWEYLQSLDRCFQAENFQAMHGSPRHNIMEYILPSDPEVDPLKIDDIFDCMVVPLAFVGHTHFPGVIEESSQAFITTQQLGKYYTPVEGRKAIINVGSVGQPRDSDVRSSYVEFDGETVWFHRVEYDVEETVRRIKASGGLHDSLGHRLREGR